MKGAVRWGVVLVLLGTLVGACDSGGGTTNPSEGAGKGSKKSRASDGPDQASAAPVMQGGDKAKSTRAKDRDPEEEKRKMALSRQRSAVAVTRLKEGNLRQAVLDARQALGHHEQNVEAMLVIAEVFLKQGRYGLVNSVCGTILRVPAELTSAAELSRAHNLQGFAYMGLKNDRAAMASFRKAADTDAQNASAWNNIGVHSLRNNQAEIAAQCFKYAVELDPSFVDARLNYGAALRALGKVVEAERVFRDVARLQPNNHLVYFNLGVLYLDAESYPGMDTTARLQSAVRELTKYKRLVLQARAQSPNGASVGSSDFGNDLVSAKQADLYIDAANKGLAREKRRQEKKRKRAEKERKKAQAEAKDKAAAQTPTPQPVAPATQTQPPAQAQPPKSSPPPQGSEGGSGGTTPSAPQQPKIQSKPSTQKISPQKPKVQPQKPKG